MVILRVIAGWFALLSILAAFGWLLSQSTAHAVGWLAACALFYVLSTIPTGSIP